MNIQQRMLAGLTGLVAIAALASGPAYALEEFRTSEIKSFDVGASPSITIESISGDVVYIGSDGSTATVDIVTEVRARDEAEAAEIREHLKMVLDGADGYLDLRMENARAFYKWLRSEYSQRHQVSVSFYVHGPRGAEGIMSSVSGEASVEGIKGPIEIESVSGDVSAVGIDGRVRAGSTSGNVDVRRVKSTATVGSVSGEVTVSGCEGDLDVSAVSGSIHAREAGGTVTAETVSGEIELVGVARDVTAESVSGSIWIDHDAGAVTASSVSGSIDLHTKTGEDIDIETVSGSVDLAVIPDGLGAVVLESPSGSIGASVPLDVTHKTRRRLEGRLGNGAATLRVSTTSGSITLGQL